jgi:hypothetical protein
MACSVSSSGSLDIPVDVVGNGRLPNTPNIGPAAPRPHPPVHSTTGQSVAVAPAHRSAGCGGSSSASAIPPTTAVIPPGRDLALPKACRVRRVGPKPIRSQTRVYNVGRRRTCVGVPTRRGHSNLRPIGVITSPRRSGFRGAWRRSYWDMPIDRSVPPTMEGDVSMMVIGIDAHKRSHTAVAVDEMGRQEQRKPLVRQHKITFGYLSGRSVWPSNGCW